jgi:hypothetical protein
VIAESWYGFVVSAKTPPAVVRRLQEALATAQADPALPAEPRPPGRERRRHRAGTVRPADQDRRREMARHRHGGRNPARVAAVTKIGSFI